MRLSFPRPSILHRYLLSQFFSVLFICLFAAISIFLVFEFFERSKTFIKEGSTVLQAISYLGLKIPLIIQLMMPVAVLIATLLAVGRLSQLSEVTAMRACGMPLTWFSYPLIAVGLGISILMFIAGETVVPWATARVEELYQVDIKKKLEKGAYSREQFWYRDARAFYNIEFYDSRNQTLQDITSFEFDDRFNLKRRTDASNAIWKGPAARWTMNNVVETVTSPTDPLQVMKFNSLPLVIKEKPEDFYKLQRKPETLGYRELGEYIKKLSAEGVPVTEYVVQRAAKISFPFVNLIVVLIAFPFALIPARSGSLTFSFVAGIVIGFSYHVVHAISLSLGAAELIPLIPAAWTANILLGSVGGYLMAGADFR